MTAKTHTERLEARVTPELKDLLLRAAELKGTTLSAFISASLQAAARCTIREHEILELNDHERELFITALLNPPAPNENLRRAAEQYRATMDV